MSDYKAVPGLPPLVVNMMFVRDGKQAHCPWGAWREAGACDGEIAYDDKDKNRLTLKCLKCGRLYADIEIEQHNLVRWS